MNVRSMLGDLQHRRLLRLSFPNDDGPVDGLVVNRLEAYECLSRPFEFTVELLSDSPDIPLKDLQGKMMCVELVRRDGTLRYFNGRVFSFGLKTVDGGVSYYEAKLGPWYKYLGLRKDNYLFHYTTIYEQTSSIFRDYGGVAEWDWKVRGADEKLTDCCQFDESDRNFLERRWASYGIIYWFEHTAAGHKLVLSDNSTNASPIDGDPEIPFQRHGGSAEEDGIGEWSPIRDIVTSTVALASFDFKSPFPAVASLPTLNQQGDVLNIESYEYTGALGFKGREGRGLTQLRMEEVEASGKRFEGSGNNRCVMPGRWFRLTGHFDSSANKRDPHANDFLIIEAWHSASNNYHVKTGVSHYENRLTCIRKVIPYRAGRDHNSVETKIHGVQTATVVGPAGEEIHTDEYGRVKVQFHWDRVGARDEKSSAWIRVATPWAGENFGMVSIPRIGTEVLVSFLGGDPNRPVITGMVPNALTMPPWTLPANKTQSGILTRSTPKGGYHNANAIRFEDKKGSEQLWLHAEKDQLTEVEHDEEKWVGNDRRKTIDRDEVNHIKRDRKEVVGHNETITVHHDRGETVHHDEQITIHNNREKRVDHDETVSIGDNRKEDVGKNEAISVGASRTKNIGKNEKDSIGRNWSISVGKTKTETVGMAYMQNVGMGRMENVGLGYSLNVGVIMATVVGVNQTTKVGKTMTVSAGDKIEFVCGDSKIVMTPTAIYIDSQEVHIKSGTKVHIDGPDDVLLNTGGAESPPGSPQSPAAEE